MQKHCFSEIGNLLWPCDRVAAVCLATVLATATTGFCGSLTPPGPPESTMKTISEAEPRTALSAAANNIVITQPGSYYLTGNLTGRSAGYHGIVIKANNVTLDLRGFSVTGVTGSGYGILVDHGLQNVNIRNGFVRSWPFGGVGNYADRCQIESVVVSSCQGIGIFAGANSEILDCTAYDNFSGTIAAGTGSLVARCRVIHNLNGRGYAIETGKYSRIADCEVVGNAEGINAGEGSVVSGCSVAEGYDGISAGENCAVTNCAVRSNTGVGIFLYGNGGTVTDCTVSSNSAIGIQSVGGKGTVSRCVVSLNKNNGIQVGDDCTVTDCEATSNTKSGIVLGYRCTARNNNCSMNGTSGGDAGINTDGKFSRIEGNNCTGNRVGITVTRDRNLVIRNSVGGNGSDIDSIAGNFVGTIITSEAAMNGSSNPNSNISIP